jgi:hypothetical protein
MLKVPFYPGIDSQLKRTFIVLMNANLDGVLQDFINAECMKFNQKVIGTGQELAD